MANIRNAQSSLFSQFQAKRVILTEQSRVILLRQPLPSVLLKRHVIMSRPVLLVLVLLTVVMTTTLVAGNNICRLAMYTKELRLHGRVQHVQAGECIVRTNYHIQPKFLNYDEGVEEADFYLNSFNITHRECCCRVGVYVLKNVRIGSTRIKYKDIESCVCQAC